MTTAIVGVAGVLIGIALSYVLFLFLTKDIRNGPFGPFR